ncbi:right-handed parallel beta-helix repeat-containing protein [Nocardioides sp. YIM 152315]|uniref:right-handed parallel beta-helix repeat-containing protein n=1 Tax=Nocardioides sp. YIM 152315 TaxID=3031760 RepID=UPI0023DB3372|nr:right-handed parallel beta-helix repeat-containing protein [Nocardioides sp. YIM 152315]MDF1603445.1 right-handed parallel beta-helix repeat-containing protein [Nocardioides sp. YIM 152315]
MDALELVIAGALAATLAASCLTGCSDDADGGTAKEAPCDVRPSADNTGATGDLRRDSTAVVEEDGATLEDVHLGSVEVRADDVTLRNVRVDGNILVTGDGVTIDHVSTTGIAISSASKAEVRYSNIGGGAEDGIHVTSDRGRLATDITLSYNFVHSPEVPPGGHYDGTQVRGVDGLLVTCSTYDAGPYESTHNAAIYLEDANGGDANVAIEHNWLLGSGFSVMLDAPGTRLIGNRVAGDPHWGTCYLGPGTTPDALTIRDNVDEATGDPDPLCTASPSAAPGDS